MYQYLKKKTKPKTKTKKKKQKRNTPPPTFRLNSNGLLRKNYVKVSRGSTCTL